MIPEIEGYDYSNEYFQSFQDSPFSTVTYVGSTVIPVTPVTQEHIITNPEKTNDTITNS